MRHVDSMTFEAARMIPVYPETIHEYTIRLVFKRFRTAGLPASMPVMEEEYNGGNYDSN